jgi:hypothetical protein
VAPDLTQGGASNHHVISHSFSKLIVLLLENEMKFVAYQIIPFDDIYPEDDLRGAAKGDMSQLD